MLAAFAYLWQYNHQRSLWNSFLCLLKWGINKRRKGIKLNGALGCRQNMGVWDLNLTTRGSVHTWSSHEDNPAVSTILWHHFSLSEVMTWRTICSFMTLQWSWLSFPPEEAEETCRLCFVSSLRLLADLRRSCSQTAWVRDEFCCPGKMTSSRHLHYKHFISCEKDKETHFSCSKKKVQLLIILSGLDILLLFVWCRSLVAKRETSRLTLQCALDLLLEHSWLSATTHALVFLLKSVHLAVNTEKCLMQMQRFVTGRSHRRKSAIVFKLQMPWKFGNTQDEKVASVNTNQRGARTQPWGTQWKK